MKNITKTIITTVLLLLTVGLFAQEDSTRAIVKDAQGISTGMTQKEFDLFKKDYRQKMEKLRMFEYTNPSKEILVQPEESKQLILRKAMEHKINLNAVKEYTNIGVDIVQAVQNCFLNTGEQDLEKRILTNDVILVGEVTDSLIILNSKPGECLNSVIKIKVNEFITGQELFNGNLPDTILSYSYEGEPGSRYLLPHVGNKYIFMFSSTSKYISKMRKTLKYCTTPELKKYSTNFDDKNVIYGWTTYDLDKLDGIRKKTQLIKKINNPADFYRRKY